MNNRTIDVGAEVTVKAGSAIPSSKAVERNEAMQLASSGSLSPQSLYEKLGWPDAEKHAIRLLNYNMGIISDEQQTQMGAGEDITQAEQADMENQAMMQGQAVQVSPNDDDRIHVQIHTVFKEQPETPPEVVEVADTHIQEHNQGGGVNAEEVGAEVTPPGYQEGLEGQA